MELHRLLLDCLLWVFYPLWLLAGGIDYLCHRRTNIEGTSGLRESVLHVVQFALLALFLTLAMVMQVGAAVIFLMAVVVVMHSGVTLLDLRYTDERRRIVPLEQWVHGFMDVLPIVALTLIGILNWERISAGKWLDVNSSEVSSIRAAVLIGSFLVLGGVPVLNELWRCLQVRRRSIAAMAHVRAVPATASATAAWRPSDRKRPPARRRR